MSGIDKNYSVVVKEVNGNFYIICETFNIVTKDNDLSVAYAELKALRNNVLERFREMGLSSPQQRNAEHLSSHGRLLQKRSNSFPKVLIVVGICLVFLVGISVPILNVVNGVIKPLTGISVKLKSVSNPAALSKMVAHVANILKEVTPERREELHQNLKTIVNELEPFVDDVRPLMLEKQNSKSTNN